MAEKIFDYDSLPEESSLHATASMTAPAEEKGATGREKRFSGENEKEYRETWRRWAKGHLFNLPDTVPLKKHGSILANLLDGEAARITSHLEIGAEKPENELGEEAALQKVWDILDRRWPN